VSTSISKDRTRSLIMAGGGIKVAYQAGCLQVLLDEAQLTFDHVDGASGGCFNAAMLCSGMSGTQIADAWRNLNPFDMIAFNTREFDKLLWARSIATLDKLRSHVFPAWGIDFEKIRRCTSPRATFNVYNFSKKRLEVIDNDAMDEDLLVASVALPMWFPPVERDGDILFDAVYCTDANVGEAVRRGADELWCIWTVADQPEYRDGFLAQYFHIIETVSDTKFFREWEEVEAVNRALERHGQDTSRATPDLMLREGYAAHADFRPPPGRKHVEQHLIKQEVPLHYLINLSQDRLAEAVEMGVRDARAYCRAKGLLRRGSDPGPAKLVTQAPIGMEFTEVMKGYFRVGADSPEEGARMGRLDNNKLMFKLTVHIEDLDQFIRYPEHEARATGYVECDALGGRLEISQARFNLFVIEDRGHIDNPKNKEMRYSLSFRAPSGQDYLLEGLKHVHDDPGIDVWTDLTTLFVKIYRIEASGRGTQKVPHAAGVLQIHLLDFVQQLTTFRVHRAQGPGQAIAALTRFGEFFLGRAWDVYARRVLDYAPF
jgi:predicted acylesterase/phospholipase RssA